MFDVLILGCGIVGAATAYELSKYQLSLGILEKANDVAAGATKANSAILHAGYDPKPGSEMSRMNVEGIKLAKEICEKLDVERRELPSLVLAFSEKEMENVRRLYEQGKKAGVHVEILTGDEVRRREPNVSSEVVGALCSNDSAIVDPWGYAIAMAEVAVLNGAELYLENEVQGIERMGDHFKVTTNQGVFEAKYLVNAAGANAIDLNEMVGDHALEPRYLCGQYYILDKCEGTRVNSVIFTCPNENGKGVLVSPTVHGNLIVGPDAFLVEGPEHTGTDPETMELLKALGHRSVPSINYREVIRQYAGVRPNTQFDAFYIKELDCAPGFVTLSGIKSPGLSAAPAIALRAIELLGAAGLPLSKKESYVDSRKVTRFRKMSAAERSALIAKDPRYGRIVCRCESVTEGEIVEALHRPIVPHTVSAVKRRCNAGMGRCQGGFCSPRVHELISRELGIPMTEVLQKGVGSPILSGTTKGGANE